MKIKQLRKKLKLTQTQMAKLIGMKQHALSDIERGADGRKETKIQKQLLKALDFIYKHGLIDEFKKL